MRILSAFTISLILFSLLGCKLTQHYITGETSVYGVEPLAGKIIDRDVIPQTSNASLDYISPHIGEVIAIEVNSAFMRHLADIGSPHVLFYVEVYDDGNEDPSKAFTKVLFNEKDVPSGTNLGFTDRIIYGPTPYKGQPIRIKFYIIELDKEDKELASMLIDVAGSLATASQPEAGPAIAVAMSTAKMLNQLNVDDYELRHDITLSPGGSLGVWKEGDENLNKLLSDPDKAYLIRRHNKNISQSAVFRTGPYLIIKRELNKRVGTRVESAGERAEIDYSNFAAVADYKTSSGDYARISEVYRYENGVLYRKITGISVRNDKNDTQIGSSNSGVTVVANSTVANSTNVNTQKVLEKVKKNKIKSVVVIPRSGPNKGMKVNLALNQRIAFRDKTYVVFSVKTGLPVAVDSQVLADTSAYSKNLIKELLDNPTMLSDSERINNSIEEASVSLKAMVEQQRIGSHAAEAVGTYPALRLDPRYVMLWSSQLNAFDNGNMTAHDKKMAAAKNSMILNALYGMLVKMPRIKPDAANKIKLLRDLNATQIIKTDNGVKLPKGKFALDPAVLDQLYSSN